MIFVFSDLSVSFRIFRLFVCFRLAFISESERKRYLSELLVMFFFFLTIESGIPGENLHTVWWWHLSIARAVIHTLTHNIQQKYVKEKTWQKQQSLLPKHTHA